MLSERPWKLEGILRLAAGVFVCLSFLIVLQALLQHFMGKARFSDGSLLYVVFSSSLHVSILVGTGFFIWSQHLSWNELFGFNRPPLGRAVGYGALATMAFLPVGIVLQEVSLRIITAYSHEAPNKQVAVEEFGKAVTWPSRAYLVFFALVLAPVAEEILFRGIIYGIVRQLGFRRFALWASAILFAASHGAAAIFLPLLVLGLLFAWLYEKTDNLLASITAHSFFNAINLVLILWGKDLLEFFQNLHSTR